MSIRALWCFFFLLVLAIGYSHPTFASRCSGNWEVRKEKLDLYRETHISFKRMFAVFRCTQPHFFRNTLSGADIASYETLLFTLHNTVKSISFGTITGPQKRPKKCHLPVPAGAGPMQGVDRALLFRCEHRKMRSVLLRRMSRKCQQF